MRRAAGFAVAAFVAALPGALAAQSTGPDYEVHYAPRANLEAIDVGLLRTSRVSIDMAAYVLTDWAILDALAEAGRRGVRVRVWRDGSEAGYTDAARLGAVQATPNVELRIKRGAGAMHLKTYCIDGNLLRTGAANFSRSGETEQNNDLVILRGASACSGFLSIFNENWTGG